MNAMPEKITIRANASGSWALLGRFSNTPYVRAELNKACASIHALSDRHTHFKLVDEKGNTLATLRDGATQFEPVKGRG